jgi:hypothetical protein
LSEICEISNLPFFPSDPFGRSHRQDSNDARVSIHQTVRRADQQVGGKTVAASGNHGRVAQSPKHLALLGKHRKKQNGRLGQSSEEFGCIGR